MSKCLETKMSKISLNASNEEVFNFLHDLTDEYFNGDKMKEIEELEKKIGFLEGFSSGLLSSEGLLSVDGLLPFEVFSLAFAVAITSLVVFALLYLSNTSLIIDYAFC